MAGMTPQDLINLPGAGNAEKQLRKMGKWVLTPLEILWQISENHCTKDANSKIDQATAILENAMEATCQ